MGRWKIAFPYLCFAAVAAGVIWSNLRAGSKPAQTTSDQSQRIVDPVCRMEVNVNWDISGEHDGVVYYFCTKRCRELFLEKPVEYLQERCMVCRKPIDPENSLPATYMETTYYLCSELHREQFKADPARFFMHRMWGIPDWLYYISIALVLLISFFLFEGSKRFSRPVKISGHPGNSVNRKDRIDLMRLSFIKKMLLSRPFRFAAQLVMAFFFILILAAGLFGHQNPALNIAPLLTWTIWWCGLVVLIMFAGKAWCYMCPWDAIATWMEKLRLWKKNDSGMGLQIPWPRMLQNITLASIFFVALTWFELGFGVTLSPRITAYLGLAMLLMAIVSAFIFERKSFCRYGCLIGRVSGLYALFAGMEFRSKEKAICRTCSSKECVKGSRDAYACPTFENPSTMKTNTYCIQCAECLQACPHDNMAVNLRPWGADLAHVNKPRRDEAYLALLMLSISAFHGLTMTPIWETLLTRVKSLFPLGRIIAFSLSMFTLMALPILVYTVLVWLCFLITQKRKQPALSLSQSSISNRSFGNYFISYAYCLLPIALFYHLAHNLEHLLMEGPKIVVRCSDPFGWGWNLFQAGNLNIPPLVSLDILWVLQVFLVGVGHVYSLWVADRISKRLSPDQSTSFRGQLPMLAGMIAFSVLSLWLLKQPMEMRTSAM